jgi:hypothetical protein
MTQANLRSFVESFNAKAAYNLEDLMIVDHWDGLLEVVYNGKTVIRTHSLFKACAKVHVLLSA